MPPHLGAYIRAPRTTRGPRADGSLRAYLRTGFVWPGGIRPSCWCSAREPPLNYNVARTTEASVLARTSFPNYRLLIVEFALIEDRIRELCENAATVDDSEVPAVFAELQALLAEHSASVRFLAAKTLNKVS
jgi:hypothetical protein